MSFNVSWNSSSSFFAAFLDIVAFSYWYVENARQDRLFKNGAEQSSYCRTNAALDAARSTYYKAKSRLGHSRCAGGRGRAKKQAPLKKPARWRGRLSIQ